MRHTTLVAGRDRKEREARHHQAAEKSRNTGIAWRGLHRPGALQGLSAGGGRGGFRRGSPPVHPFPRGPRYGTGEHTGLVTMGEQKCEHPHCRSAGPGLRETGVAGPGDKTRAREDRVKGNRKDPAGAGAGAELLGQIWSRELGGSAGPQRGGLGSEPGQTMDRVNSLVSGGL